MMMLTFVVDTQAFCGDSFTGVSDSTAVSNRSNFASEFSDRLNGVQSQQYRRRVQQQKPQRSASSPAAEDGQLQRRSSSQEYDVDLSPADVDDNDSVQVQTKLFDPISFKMLVCLMRT